VFASCYGLHSCSPHRDDHLCFRQAPGTFTTELAHVRSPSHESVITTWVNRQFPGRDFHPLETQPYGLHASSLSYGQWLAGRACGGRTLFVEGQEIQPPLCKYPAIMSPGSRPR
jgi:hypothetical protein